MADNVVTADYRAREKRSLNPREKRFLLFFFFFFSSSDFLSTHYATHTVINNSFRENSTSRLSLVSPASSRRKYDFRIIYLLTLYVQVDRHFVAAVSVRGYAEVSRAVLSTRAYKLERADDAVGRVLLLKRVPIVGQFLLQVGAHLLPKYLQGMIALRLAAQGRARAQPRCLVTVFLREMGGHCVRLLCDRQ